MGLTTQRTVGFSLGMVLVLACAQVNEEEAGRTELEQAIDDFYASIESGENESRAEMFTDEAMMMPDDGAIIRGKDNIGEVVRSGGGWVFRIRNLNRAEIDLSGDIAYTVNEYEYTWHQADGEPIWHPTKNIHIWRRQADGSWKLHVDIWNGSEQ